MRVRFKIVLAVVGLLVIALLPLARVPAGDIVITGEDPAPAGTPIGPANGASAGALVGYTECKTPCRLVNSRRIRLEYSIADVGPSGVSSVELWATRDGKTWQRYSNEPPPAGPLVVCVAEEGRYGFSIVVKNGLGFSGPAPRSGDEPQLWVEVDETKPAVRLTDCVVGHAQEAGYLEVCWNASDVNLSDRPITLSTAVSPEGPWTPAATGLANTGKYVWKMPKEMPYEVYVRVEACDRAGNVGSDHSGKPVRVDMARPRGTITGADGDRNAAPHSQIPSPTIVPVSGTTNSATKAGTVGWSFTR
jgi:hypothetical protein